MSKIAPRLERADTIQRLFSTGSKQINGKRYWVLFFLCFKEKCQKKKKKYEKLTPTKKKKKITHLSYVKPISFSLKLLYIRGMTIK